MGRRFENRREQKKARPRPDLLSISFWRDNAGNVRIFALCFFHSLAASRATILSHCQVNTLGCTERYLIRDLLHP